MKESTKKLLKAIACMAGCAAISGMAGKGVDYAKDKIINSEPDSDDGHVPTEEEIAELVEASPESMVEEAINETEEEVKEENKD